MNSQAVRADPWERQAGETSVAFQAFATYRDMGADRSTRKVAKQLGKNESLIQGWSRTHSWVLRVNAWDAELDRMDRLEVIEQRRQMRKRHVEIAVAFQAKLSDQLDNLAPEAIERMLSDPTAMARWFDVATKVERAALGDAGQDIAGRRKPESADEVDLTDLTDEEIRQRMEDLRRDIDSALGEYDGDPDGPDGSDDGDDE